jgi:hypothetical protein
MIVSTISNNIMKKLQNERKKCLTVSYYEIMTKEENQNVF